MKLSIVKRFISATMFVAGAVFGPAAAAAPLTAVDAQAAAAVAGNWLQLGHELNWYTSPGEGNPDRPAMQEIRHEGELLGYAALFDGGYVIVPAFTELPPITAYSTDSRLNLDDEGGIALLIREALAYKIMVARDALTATSPDPELQPIIEQIALDRQQWQAYAGSYVDFTTALAADNVHSTLDDVPEVDNPYGIMTVNPLLTTAWHQRWPYYNLDPMGDGGRTPLGCVATAAAQIVAYWRYPVNGTGSHSYVWNGDQSCGHNLAGQTLSATFSDGYDWPNILDSYRGTETPAQFAAVAELNYEVAIALQTDFGRCVSTAVTATVADILPEHFGFSTEIDRENRNAYTSAQAWFNMLIQDLNEGWPMQYRIAGHSIVCDGWRVSGTNQLHMNYGWADGHTTWYTVDNLYCTASGCSPQTEYVIRRIHPAGAGNNPPRLTVTRPNGGESLTLGQVTAFTWTSANLNENVRIELNRSYPGGTWETLTSSAANTGSYSWTVTGAATSTARIRIRGVSNTAVCDSSNANFTIEAAASDAGLTITSPNGGETLTAGQTNRVHWTSTNLTGNLRIEIDRNYPSGDWETIVAVTNNDGGHTWTVTGPGTTRARIRVLSLAYPGVGDTTNGNITIVDNSPRLTVTSPNGGEVLTIGNNNRIYFTFQNLVGNIKIEINRNYPAGAWETLVGVTNLDGGHTWTVNGPATDNARIRLISLVYPSVGDTSNEDFAIAQEQGGEGAAGPGETALDDAYPNPFNPTTTIRYALAEDARVRLEVFDVNGRRAALLVDGQQSAGEYTARFDGAGLAAGTYFLRMSAGEFQSVRKLLLMK